MEIRGVFTFPGIGLLFCGVALASGIARAETDTTAPPNLAAVVAAAYAFRQEAGPVQARRELGQALRQRAGSLLADDPSFNLKYQTDRVGSAKGFREWEGGTTLPLWWPGQRTAQRQAAEATLASAELLARARRLEVAGRVRELVWQLALAESRRTESRQALDSAQQLARSVERRVKAGDLPRSDRVLAESEVLSAEDAVAQAENRVQQALQAYRRYTGLQPPPATVPETVADVATLPGDHPRLALLANAVQRTRSERQRVSSERHKGTSLWLGGRSTRDVTGNGYDSALGMELNVPLGSRVANAPALRQAEETLSTAITEQRQAVSDLQSQLDQTRLDYQRARAALERAQQSRTLADESLQFTQRAFQLGETDLVRLLQARRAAITAHQNLQLRRLEVGRSAARLNQALGVIPQ